MSNMKMRLAAALLALGSLPILNFGRSPLAGWGGRPETDPFGSRGRRGRGRSSKERAPKLGGAVPYAKLAPVVDGVRMRWEFGALVPRVSGAVLGRPLTERQKQRAAAKRAKQRGAHRSSKKIQTPKGVYRRNDLKGAMRKARRAGLISPRQQRKFHRAGRAGAQS